MIELICEITDKTIRCLDCAAVIERGHKKPPTLYCKCKKIMLGYVGDHDIIRIDNKEYIIVDRNSDIIKEIIKSEPKKQQTTLFDLQEYECNNKATECNFAEFTEEPQ